MRYHLREGDRHCIIVKEFPPEYTCRACGETKPITEFPRYRYDTDRYSFRPLCKDCNRKHSSVYLGITVTEKVLSKVFTNVQRMPYRNHGYDFICGKGFKVDAKASCLTIPTYNCSMWMFFINYNKTADYFACLAFDNRASLTPLHFWLIPGTALLPWGRGSKKTVRKAQDSNYISISPKTLDKWKDYEKPIDKVLTSCNIMKSTLSYFMRV